MENNVNENLKKLEELIKSKDNKRNKKYQTEEERIEATRIKSREYYNNNKEKIREHQRTYKQKKKLEYQLLKAIYMEDQKNIKINN